MGETNGIWRISGEQAVGEAARRLTYTWDDYRSWEDGQRWDIIDGQAYAMTPAPSTRHQILLHELDCRLGNFFRGRECRVFPAPTDVKLDDANIVQPDLAVVSDKEKVKPSHIEGAPTLVIEILSPSTSAFDRTRKLRLYARSGVKEVWLITPYPWLAEVLLLDQGCYRLANAYEREETLQSVVFPDLHIALPDIFNYPIDPDESVDMVREGRPPYGKDESIA